ncbi:MAG TPA: UDP-N-acetylmuramoyl-L-alanine--D-glutamate ligase [Burkholderiaceae bacterium]|nr:UDP-N-acetylmuramoyl-L-alanine--D-glutamate ligase [Burkholderiaceae bacterium]
MSFPSVGAGDLTLILGLGETGLAAARWCLTHGARLRVLDTRLKPAGVDALKAEPGAGGIDFRLGPDAVSADALEGAVRVVLSPGLSPLQEPVKSFLARAVERNVEVVGEIELFARALTDMAAHGYAPKVLAVTGTNGKTTVTALTRHLVEAGGLSARAAGNISPAALAALADALASGNLPDVWVLELSSFQLETTTSLVPDAATVLNLTQDHLDWHGSMQAYGAAKARLAAMAKVAIINRDDPLVAAMVPDTRGRDVRTFGVGEPSCCGDMGIENSHGVAWLAASEVNDFDLPVRPSRRKKNEAEPARDEGRMVRLMPLDALRIRGMHNAMNALAALALARSLGIGWAAMLPALREYRGEPHRTEFVRTIEGVDFINDSKGTNVGATVAALEGLGRKVVLIAGGLGKGQDFSPLSDSVRRHARAVVLIGQDGPIIGRALAQSGVELAHAESLAEAVKCALGMAREGDAVLLSPACASMDMFRNYRHRGTSFVEEVQALALDRGEMA